MKRYYESGEARDLRQDQLKRIRRVIGLLDSAQYIEDVDQLPGMRLHPLKGDLAGFWSVSIIGNWRVIFRFESGDAFDVDLLDYH